jgi:hypothetical protein
MTASDIGKCGKHPLTTALELESFFPYGASRCLPADQFTRMGMLVKNPIEETLASASDIGLLMIKSRENGRSR